MGRYFCPCYRLESSRSMLPLLKWLVIQRCAIFGPSQDNKSKRTHNVQSVCLTLILFMRPEPSSFQRTQLLILFYWEFQYKIRTGPNLGVIASWTKSDCLLFCSQRRTEWARRWVGRIGCGEVPSSPSWQCLSRRTPRWWMGKLNASYSQRLSYYTRLGESKIGA